MNLMHERYTVPAFPTTKDAIGWAASYQMKEVFSVYILETHSMAILVRDAQGEYQAKFDVSNTDSLTFH